MSVSILQWISRRQMSAAKRLIQSPGHVSMVLLFPDHTGETHSFAHTITWFPSENQENRPKYKDNSSGRLMANLSGVFHSPSKWVPENLFAEMDYLGTGTGLSAWLEQNNQPWLRMYLDNMQNTLTNSAFNLMLKKYVRPPDRQVTIRSRSDADSYTGLFDANIRTWWLAFADKHKTYSLIRRSCASVVGTALFEGGAEAFAPQPRGIWTPDSVFEWADRISQAVEKENNDMRSSFETLAVEYKKFPNPGKLWTQKEWYRESEKNVSFLSRRYGLLKTIDSLLDVYHSIDGRPRLTKEHKKQAKMACLTMIMDALAKILHERSNTKRLASIGQLASQVNKTFREIQDEERILIRKLREKEQLLEEEIEHHNAPIWEVLDQISDQQYELFTLIENVKQGNTKLESGMTLKHLEQQLDYVTNLGNVWRQKLR